MLGLFCRTGRYSSVNVRGRSRKCRLVANRPASPGAAGIEQATTTDRKPQGLPTKDDPKPERPCRRQVVWPGEAPPRMALRARIGLGAGEPADRRDRDSGAARAKTVACTDQVRLAPGTGVHRVYMFPRRRQQRAIISGRAGHLTGVFGRETAGMESIRHRMEKENRSVRLLLRETYSARN